MCNKTINKKFYERQIKRLEKRLEDFYSDDSNKTEHYFVDKGFIQGVLYAYHNVLDDIEDNEKFTLNEIEEAINKSWEDKLDLLIYPEEQNMILVKNATNEDKAYLSKTSIWEPKYYTSYEEYKSDILNYFKGCL